MTRKNNYDKSSTGTDIECTCFYDSDASQRAFDENFKIMKHSGYRDSTVAYYIECGNVEDDDSITFSVKGTAEQISAMYDLNGYNEDDCPPLEDIKDYIETWYGENITILNYEACNSQFKDSGVSLVPSKNLIRVAIRGYSQGDYAEVIYCPDDLQKAWGNAPKESELKETFTHLFYDAPVYAQFTIYPADGSESAKEYNLWDSPDYSEYDFDRDKFLDYVAKESGVARETLAEIFPKEPSYN